MPVSLIPWPDEAVELSPDKVIDMYVNGFAGAFHSPEEAEKLADSMQWKNFGDAAVEFGLEDSGAGKLSLPFMSLLKLAPTCFPGPAQTTGDCASRGTANACQVTLGVEVDLGIPDPDTGVVEGFPDIPEPSQGIIASEPIYGYRGHSGQGANVQRLAQFMTTAGGILLRKPYPSLGIDLTKYDSSIGARWGGRGTPANVCVEGKLHQVRTCTAIKSTEQARDALANGYGINVGSNYGFTDTRNEDGVSKRSRPWNHAMSWIAVDDTPETRKKYNGMLFLVMNSWARFNRGPLANHQPEGSFWIVESDARGMIAQGGAVAFSNTNGFPGRDLPNYLVI